MRLFVCVCVSGDRPTSKSGFPTDTKSVFAASFSVSLDLSPILTSSGQTAKSAAFKYEVALNVCVCVFHVD